MSQRPSSPPLVQFTSNSEALLHWFNARRLVRAIGGLPLWVFLATCSEDSTAPPVTESFDLPANATTAEGDNVNLSPFKGSAGRFQGVYGASLVPIPVGARITGMSFRLDGTSVAFTNVTIDNLEIRMSTSANPPGSLSTTFASNRGANEVLVRTGPLAIASTDYPAGGTPNAFGPVIQFSRPFVYQGGPLLLEVAFTGLPPAEARLVDDVFPATDSQSGYGSGFGATSADLGRFSDLIVVRYQFIRP